MDAGRLLAVRHIDPLVLTAPAVISVRAVGYHYRSAPALDDVTFDLHPGVTALVGVNGAGKTTLLNLLATRLSPQVGSIEFGSGHELPGASARVLTALRTQVSLAPQEFEVPRHLRVEDFMRYMAWARAVRRSERDPQIVDALAAVDLSGRRRMRIGSLSGGMRRRLNIAQALLNEPRLILLDEPFAGLDPEQRTGLRDRIRELDRAAAAVVISSHELQDVGLIAARVIMLDAGRVVFDGTLDRLEQLGRDAVTPRSGVSPLEAAFLALRQGVRP